MIDPSITAYILHINPDTYNFPLSTFDLKIFSLMRFFDQFLTLLFLHFPNTAMLSFYSVRLHNQYPLNFAKYPLNLLNYPIIQINLLQNLFITIKASVHKVTYLIVCAIIS